MSNIEELLKTLHQDYLKSLPEKIKVISAQVSAGDTTNVRESFHKLKGTGKTYGFPEVSELAAVIEKICIDEPKAALDAAGQALSVLEDIYKARQMQSSHAIDTDSRVAAIRKLLPG